MEVLHALLLNEWRLPEQAKPNFVISIIGRDVSSRVPASVSRVRRLLTTFSL